MGYVGNQTTTSFTSMDKQTITGSGATTYTLSHNVSSESEIEVFVNNIRQEGGSGKAYTVSANQITFSEAVTSSDSIYVVFQGKAIQTVVPPDGSVGTAKIADDAVTSAKLDTNIAVAGDLTVDTSTLKVDSSNNRVGIGTASPSALTTIKTASSEEDAILIKQSDGTDIGSISVHGGAFKVQGKSSTAPVQLQTHDGNEDIEVDPDGFIKMETAGAERVRIDNSGNLTLATTDTSQTAGVGVKLLTAGRVFSVTANGSGECFSSYQVGAGYKFYVTNNGKIHTAVGPAVYSVSDERLKENIKDLDKGLTDILKLKPRTFDWKKGEGSGEKGVSGFIAQECEEAGFEEFVGDFKHDTLTDGKSFGYGGLVPSLVKAIQELSAKNDALEARITKLEAK